MEDGFLHYAIISWCHHTVRGSYNTRLEAEIVALLSTPEMRQRWLFQMLFKHDDLFPFQKIFRLRKISKLGPQRVAVCQ